MPTSMQHSTGGGPDAGGWLARLRGIVRRDAAVSLPAELLDAVPDPVLVVDADDVIRAANRAVGLVLGYDPEQLVGEGLAETLLLPAVREAHRARVRRYATTGRDPVPSSGGVLQVVRANGTEMEVEMSVRATSGRRARLAVCLHDARALRTVEAALDAAEGRQRTLRTIVDAIPDPVVAVNRQGRIVLRNLAGAHSTVAGPEAGGEDALPADEWRKAAAVMQSGEAVYASEEPGGGGVRLVTRVPVREPSGAVVGLVAISRDVTDQKAAEAALRNGKRAAEEAARANRDFLATTSHEVRTLMSGVTGMITLLQGTDLDEEQRDYVGTVESSSEALLAVINDVLDLSKLEAGMLTIENRPFRVRRLVKDTLALVAQQAEAKGLALSSDVDAGIADVVHGDEGRIRQVLANLLTNAVKFTAEGAVRVVVAPGPQTAQGGPSLAFAVEDTGVGIPPERLSAVFERFQQADASTARTHGGTGLGLAICRQLVQSMGGELTAESVPDLGSAFRFTVALGTAEAGTADGEAAGPAPADAWVSRPADPTPERPLPASPPVASAGGAPAADEAPPDRPDRAVVMSMDAVLPSARVLVVEDDAVLQRVTALTLRRLGYSPEVVGNGQEAVQAVRSQPYDVVLMDVMMPVMNGLDATRHIRLDPGPHAAPAIVALTANAMEEDRRKCLAAGCDDYLAKPVQPRQLATTIEKAIRTRADDPRPVAVEEPDIVIS